VLIKGQAACKIAVRISSAPRVMFPASSINLQTSLDVINGKLILRVAAIRQVFEMSPTSIEFVSSLETSRLLFSSRDLARGFSGCCESLSEGLL
jgi:hypothetical protein